MGGEGALWRPSGHLLDDVSWPPGADPAAPEAVTMPGAVALGGLGGAAAVLAALLPRLSSVTALDLTGAAECGDDDFASLAALPRLASLEVGGWPLLTADGVRRFVADSRRSTVLPAQPPLLTSRDAAHGAAARSLVGQEPLRATPLRSLSLADCRRIDDDAVFAVGRGLPGLSDLCLFGCSMVTERAAASFSGLTTRLDRLCVTGAYKFGSDAVRFLLTSVNPHMLMYVSPGMFRRIPFDAGPPPADAFGDKPPGTDEPPTVEALTPAPSMMRQRSSWRR